jgi:beta-D-xylosidase 4
MFQAQGIKSPCVDDRSKSKGAPRIGLPAYNWWGEALHGVAGAPGINFTGEYSTATSFPMPLLMAAAFDDDLIYDIAVIIGNESRAFGNGGEAPLDYWTPDINPFRDPRWGRGSETPGEDILRVKGYTKALLAGLEGDQPERKIVATCKHYVGYDMEAWGGTDRHHFDAQITMQDLAEYYMPPFQQCARDSKVGSFMCSYNAVNGVPTCADTYVLQDVLRDHWNWTDSNNYIVSDCEAVADISENHNYTDTLAQGTALAFKNGMDISCEYSGSSDIPGAWNQSLLDVPTIDRALLRQYEGLVRAGYFDGDAATYANLGVKDINTPEAQRLSLQVASEGIVMLKNNNSTLPLSLTAGTKVAMIGFWANDTTKLSGIYSGPAPYYRTPFYAGEQLGLDMMLAQGPILQNSTARDNWTANALAATEGSDYIIYFGGLDTSLAAETVDRGYISWPTAQVDLITKLSQLGKPLVVVALGDMVDNTPILALPGVNSILWTNWPGQDGGSAVMNVVSGKTAVAGRLPITEYPAHYTNLSMLDMGLRPSATSPGRTYRWYNQAVQPFGFGMHYTTFDAGFASKNLTYNVAHIMSNCTAPYPDLCPVPSIPITVANTGNTTSDFVALAFIKGDVGPVPYPLKTLISYKRLRGIAGGQAQTAKLQLTLGNLARVNERGDTVVYPGEYTVMLDEPTMAEVKVVVTGEETVLDSWPQPKRGNGTITGYRS